MSNDATSLDDLRKQALHAFQSGDTAQAMQVFQGIVDNAEFQDRLLVSDHMVLAACLFQIGNITDAISRTRAAQALDPEDGQVAENLGVCLLRVGQCDEALKNLLIAREKDPEKPNIYDGLAATYNLMRQFDKAIEVGTQALLIKDRQAMTAESPYSLTQKRPGPFDPARPERNIISFSLWGDKPRYLEGAVKNAVYAQVIYPGWRCRFYCDDSVPETCLQTLRKHGAQITMMPRFRHPQEGLFWRFLIADDAGVDRFLVRDCDSVVNVRERVAVDEWLASGRCFHVMRDWYTHTEVMLAGLWGGITGVLPSMQTMINEFRPNVIAAWNLDQLFLRNVLWPMVRQSVMAHDSKFNMPNSRPFPALGRLPADYHVGQNDYYFTENRPAKVQSVR